MIRRMLLALIALVVAAPALAVAPATVRVEIVTTQGAILLDLDQRHAPITTRNFLAYVDQKRFDGTSFYRASRADGNPRDGLVQGGINGAMTKVLKPVPHEPTSRTGLHHDDGTISMARDDPGTATGDFFIVVGKGRYLDAAGRDPGYAAFGHVVRGMDLVRRMLAGKTYPGGWTADTKGQFLVHPIRIVTVRRVP